MHGYPRTRFRIGQRMVVVLQCKAEEIGHRMQLVVSQPFQLPRSLIGAIKFIIRIIHAISAEYGLQATLIKSLVVSNQRKPLYFGGNLLPHFRKDRSMSGVFLRQPVHTGIPIQIVVRLGPDKTVKPVGYLTIPHNDHPHATHTGTLIVCRLKVYCCKIIHTLFDYTDKDTTKKRYTKFFSPVARFCSLKPKRHRHRKYQKARTHVHLHATVCAGSYMRMCKPTHTYMFIRRCVRPWIYSFQCLNSKKEHHL